MKSFLVICCIIAASLFVGSTSANLCETLAPKTNGVDKTPIALVNLWVNASITAYAANPTFELLFASINESTTAAHVSFYGRYVRLADIYNFILINIEIRVYIPISLKLIQIAKSFVFLFANRLFSQFY